jgi:hypothetical protein
MARGSRVPRSPKAPANSSRLKMYLDFIGVVSMRCSVAFSLHPVKTFLVVEIQIKVYYFDRVCIWRLTILFFQPRNTRKSRNIFGIKLVFLISPGLNSPQLAAIKVS